MIKKCVKCGAIIGVKCVSCYENDIRSSSPILYALYSPKLERYLQDGSTVNMWGTHERWAKFILNDLKSMHNRHATSEDMYGSSEYSELIYNSYVIPLEHINGQRIPDFLNAFPFDDIWWME